MQMIAPFFTLKGNALEAMNCYVSIFPDSKIEQLSYFEEGENGIVGQVKHGALSIMGMTVMFMDMDPSICPDLNFASSLFVELNDEVLFDNIFEKLALDGIVLMGPEPIFSLRKVAWVTDVFKITWQLILK